MTTRSPRPGATVWPNTEGTASVAQTVSKAPDTNVRRHRLVEAPTANRNHHQNPSQRHYRLQDSHDAEIAVDPPHPDQ